MTNPEKSFDVPPRGDRNPDPVTNAPGSHPIETGIGAALAGAASGMAVGAVTGPLGAALGATLGAIAGGLAGKGFGELIDPTTEDNWLRDNYKTRPYVQPGDTFDAHVPAYRYGAQAEAKYGDKPYAAIEDELKGEWEDPDKTWERVTPAVQDGYERACAIRKQRSDMS